MELTGKFREFSVLDITKKDGTTMQKGTMVVDIEAQYPFTVAYSVFKDDLVKQCLQLTSGQTVTVRSDVKSREYNGKWYHDITAWTINIGDAQEINSPIMQKDPVPFDAPPSGSPKEPVVEENDDLPF